MQESIDVGGVKWTFTENAEHFSMERFNHFKQYLIEKESGVALPSLIEQLQKFFAGFDKDSKAEMVIAIYDYFNGVKKVNDLEDPHQLMLTMILNEPGEDLERWSKKFGKQKLKKLAPLKMTQGDVIEHVETFIKGCPILSVYYFRKILEMTDSPKPDKQ